MNANRWTLYKAADKQGTVYIKLDASELRKRYFEGYRWVDRGFKLESIHDVLQDLDFSENMQLYDEQEGSLSDLDLAQEELEITSLQNSLRRFAWTGQ